MYQGRIQDIKLGGRGAFKKLRRVVGGANIFGVFRVKNHDFTPTNHIFSNFRWGARRVRPPPLDPSMCTFYQGACKICNCIQQNYFFKRSEMKKVRYNSYESTRETGKFKYVNFTLLKRFIF